MANIGIIGGTFDPIHYGHLILAEQAREVFELDKVLFVTASVPPHKADNRISDASDRHQMVKLAIMGNESFEPSEIELQREGPSYSITTVEILTSNNPSDRFFLLLGSDEAVMFGTWYQPERITELTQVVAANRPGWSVTEALAELPEQLARRIKILQIPGVDISSSDIRQRVSKDRSIRYLVPREVADYINLRGLYKGI